MRRAITGLACAAMLGSSGCALLASANAHHNSRGTACIETPAFAFVDLVIGGLAAAGIASSEESAGYYAVPGVFLASGTIGAISAFRCQGTREYVAGEAPPASNSAPSFGDAPVDPEARMATPEEMGIFPVRPSPSTRPPLHPVLKVRIDSNVLIEQPVEAEEPISCRDAPGACPPSQSCAIAGPNAGTCVAD